jgi:RNA polymerase sigma-70 factor (ECF subfamily)
MIASHDQGLSPAECTRLIALARADATETLGTLLDHYRGFLRCLANDGLDRRLSHKADASDLVQETYFEAARDFSQFRGTTKVELQAWLRQIMNNELLNVARHYKATQKRNTQREVSMHAVGSEAAVSVANLVDNTATPPSRAISQEGHEKLLTEIAQLPENRQRVICLRSIERLTFQEVGAELGISSDAARKLWARAIEDLSQTMGPQ